MQLCVVVFAVLMGVVSSQSSEGTTETFSQLKTQSGACGKYGNDDYLTMIPQLLTVSGTGGVFELYNAHNHSNPSPSTYLANGRADEYSQSTFSGGCALVLNEDDDSLVVGWGRMPCKCSSISHVYDDKEGGIANVVCDVRVPGKHGGTMSEVVCTASYTYQSQPF